jgi:hypothetical protein
MHDAADNFPIAPRLYAAPMHRNERLSNTAHCWSLNQNSLANCFAPINQGA